MKADLVTLKQRILRFFRTKKDKRFVDEALVEACRRGAFWGG